MREVACMKHGSARNGGPRRFFKFMFQCEANLESKNKNALNHQKESLIEKLANSMHAKGVKTKMKSTLFIFLFLIDTCKWSHSKH